MITKAIIKNHTALSKKGSTYIDLDLKDIFNVIVGRNGFGKTSLLRELTHYPPDNADYNKGGYKETHHVVGKNTFILKSTTGKGSEHHFIMNGKELNEGNTLLVQRELVKIHFGVTNNIKNIISGLDVRDLFTTLSTARRKEFLMSVNPNDTTYALKIFERLKSNLSAIKGGLKTQRQRLVVEEGRMASLAGLEPEALNKEIAAMDDQIKNALIIHGELAHVEEPDLLGYKKKIGNIITFLLSTSTRVEHPESVLRQMLETYNSSVDYYKNLEVRLTSVLMEVSTQLAGVDLSNHNLDSYKDILFKNNQATELYKEELEYIERRFDNHPIFLELFKDKDFCNISEQLSYYLINVNRTTDEDITSTKYIENRNKLQELSNELEKVSRKLSEIHHTLNHFNKADTVNCPKCENKFKLGFENINPETLKLEALAFEERKNNLTKRVNNVKDYLESNLGWFESMESLIRFARQTDYAPQIVKMVQNYRIGKTDTSELSNIIKSVPEYHSIKDTLTVLAKEHESVTTQIKFLESTNVEQLFKRAEYVERELSTAQSHLSMVLGKIRYVEKQLEVLLEDEQRRDALKILVKELEEAMVQHGKFSIKLRVKEVINDLTPRKSQLVSNLIRSESLHSVIESIKDNIKDLEKREKHNQFLMDGLSPVKGMIGYYMNDFLRSVVANVNAIIQPIWTNRLHVLNCSQSKSEEDVDLTYTFPVLSGNGDKPAKDIGDCSGGEREIINFAFRLVLLRYLGDKSSLPLIMDEVGVAFDELHRGRFCAYIAEQLRLDKLPKTFMISHSYKEIASAVGKANFIALNTEGLRLGFELNKNSIIK